MGTLYLVATPIGNLEDITFRALRILKQVNLIAAEDTRQTSKLLNHYQINTSMTSYHEHNKLVKLDRILSTLDQGDVALVSDAGMPALNDPGLELVRAVIHAGHQVSPIPGASAPLSALISSGFATDSFLYLGYLPRRGSDRRELLASVGNLPYTLIFLETPHRLVAALQDLQDVLGDRQICIGREMTKIHEEFFRGGFSQAKTHFREFPARGEFTLIVEGFQGIDLMWEEAELNLRIHEDLARGLATTQIASRLADVSGWPRRDIYRMIMAIRRETDDQIG